PPASCTMPIRKTRATKEKSPETEEGTPATPAPRRKTTRARAAADEASPAPKKRTRKAAVVEEPAPEVEPEPEFRHEAHDDRDDHDEPERDEDEEGVARPVLTAMPRPVRDDELQESGGQYPESEAAASLPPPPEPPVPSIDTSEGAPMQVLKLRSEERRVGKECKTWGARDQQRKKTEC